MNINGKMNDIIALIISIAIFIRATGNFIKQTYGDVQTFIISQIEVTINLLKTNKLEMAMDANFHNFECYSENCMCSERFII